MSNVRIEIASKAFTTKRGKARGTGNDYVIYRQEAYLHNGHHYPERFEVPLSAEEGKEPVPYEPGFYTLCPSSLKVGEYKDLEINRFDFKLLRLDEGSAAGKTAKAA